MEEKTGQIKQIKNSIAEINELKPVKPELLDNKNLWDPTFENEVTVVYAKLLSADVPKNHLEKSVEDSVESDNYQVEDVRKIEELTNYEVLVEIHLVD